MTKLIDFLHPYYALPFSQLPLQQRNLSIQKYFVKRPKATKCFDKALALVTYIETPTPTKG